MGGGVAAKTGAQGPKDQLKVQKDGVPAVAQQNQWHLCSTRTQVRSLALLSSDLILARELYVMQASKKEKKKLLQVFFLSWPHIWKFLGQGSTPATAETMLG